jgi:hypothetical protein
MEEGERRRGKERSGGVLDPVTVEPLTSMSSAASGSATGDVGERGGVRIGLTLMPHHVDPPLYLDVRTPGHCGPCRPYGPLLGHSFQAWPVPHAYAGLSGFW